MKLKFIIDKKYDKMIARHLRYPKEILDKVDKFYTKSGFVLEETVKMYQKSWDLINKEFSDYIEKKTGYKWFFPKYECVVSVMHKGISDWGNFPKIVRIWNENPYDMRKITAHELILSHYFGIHKKYYKDSGLTDGQIWALAEIAAFSLTSLTKDVKKWWPWDTRYPLKHNYPYLVNLQKKLEPVFLKSKNFDDYIKEGIKLVKKYPGINPRGIEG